MTGEHDGFPRGGASLGPDVVARNSGLLVRRDALPESHHASPADYDPQKEQLEQLDAALDEKRGAYVDIAIKQGALDQGGFVLGQLARWRGENEELDQAYNAYVEAIIARVGYDLAGLRVQEAALKKPWRLDSTPGLTQEEATDRSAQGEPNDLLTTGVVAEWQKLGKAFSKQLPERNGVMRYATSPVVAGLGAGALNLAEIGPAGLAVAAVSVGGVVAATKLRATQDGIKGADPTKRPNDDVQYSVSETLDTFFEPNTRDERAEAVRRWMRLNGIDKGRLQRLQSQYAQDRARIVTDLATGLDDSERTSDDLRTEAAVKLMLLELEQAQRGRLKEARRRPQFWRGVTVTGLTLAVMAVGGTLGARAQQQEDLEQQRKDLQEQIDKLPPTDNGVPDEDPTDYEGLYEQGKEANQ